MKTLVLILVALAFLLCLGMALIGFLGATRSIRERGWKTPGFDPPRYLWDKQDKRDKQGRADSSPDDE